METKFTKGEWKVYEYNAPHWNNPNLPHITIHYGDNEEHIVDTVYELADAHLIATSPKMYKMLERVCNELIPIAGETEKQESFRFEILDLLAEARGEHENNT